MLTRLAIKNFKRFGDAEIEMGNPVVFVGPNNSGKTTALQALALWDMALRRWIERRGDGQPPEKRPGVAIGRKDILAAPVPLLKLLWRDKRTHNSSKSDSGKTISRSVGFEIDVHGTHLEETWRVGLEFEYANEESLYCRPVEIAAIPRGARETRVAYLPPMSGLQAAETLLPPGGIQVRLGEGRTADVLRNLCYTLASDPTKSAIWDSVVTRIRGLFGVQLLPPELVHARGELRMNYLERNGTELDLSSAGRGLQQTLLLLAYMGANPGSVLLLDEPDAHLEILRQRDIYRVLSESARQTGAQVVAASHSEVLLEEAAARDVVVAFVGRPHRIDQRGSQVAKALRNFPAEHYYLAEQKGWVLYLEGSTDLAILRVFADKLRHAEALAALEQPFVYYIQNNPGTARDHFYGLREAKRDLVGLAIFDHDADAKVKSHAPSLVLLEHAWTRREIENYFASPRALEAWARAQGSEGRDMHLIAHRWAEAMTASIAAIQEAMRTLGQEPWSDQEKASDVVTTILRRFYQELKLGVLADKSDLHDIARFAAPEDLPAEVNKVLEMIADTARRASPLVDPD